MAQLPDVLGGVEDDGVHVVGGDLPAGAEDQLAALVESDGDLTVVVLPTDVDAQSLARSVLEARGGTVVVLDPSEAALADARLDRGEVEEALERAGADGASLDPVVAATALSQAADAVAAGAGGVPWLPIGGAALVVVLVVAVVGRAAERRRQRRRDAAAITALRDALQDHVQEVADLVLDLEPAIPLARDDAVRAAYTDAGATYRRVSDAYPAAATRAELQRLTDELEAARETLVNLRARLP